MPSQSGDSYCIEGELVRDLIDYQCDDFSGYHTTTPPAESSAPKIPKFIRSFWTNPRGYVEDMRRSGGE